MAGITLLIGLLLAILTFANASSIGIPLVSIVLPVKPRSVEMQAQMIQTHLGHHEYVPCIGHVVQYKLPAETNWNFSNVTVLNDGKFILDNLHPGETYHVRVACKDEKKSVGPFTDAIKVETPLRLITPSNGSGNGGADGTTSTSTENPENGVARSSISFYGALISLILALAFNLKQSC